MTLLGGWTALVGPAASAKRKKRKKKKKKTSPPPPPPPPPPPGPNPSCPGPPDISTGGQRFAQTFVAQRSGLLTSAQCDVSQLDGDEVFTLEIRTLNGAGAPTATVLDSATIWNVPPSPTQTYTLSVDFASPASIVAGQGYALVVTVAPGQGFLIRARDGGDTCAGQMYYDPAVDNTFIPLPDRDMIFAASITV